MRGSVKTFSNVRAWRKFELLRWLVCGDKLEGTHEGKIPGSIAARGKPCAVKGMYLIVAHLRAYA